MKNIQVLPDLEVMPPLLLPSCIRNAADRCANIAVQPRMATRAYWPTRGGLSFSWPQRDVQLNGQISNG